MCSRAVKKTRAEPWDPWQPLCLSLDAVWATSCCCCPAAQSGFTLQSIWELALPWSDSSVCYFTTAGGNSRPPHNPVSNPVPGLLPPLGSAQVAWIIAPRSELSASLSHCLTPLPVTFSPLQLHSLPGPLHSQLPKINPSPSRWVSTPRCWSHKRQVSPKGNYLWFGTCCILTKFPAVEFSFQGTDSKLRGWVCVWGMGKSKKNTANY